MEKQTVYIPVDVKNGLPDNKSKKEFVIYGEHSAKGTLHKDGFQNWNVTHWLEKKENVYVFTPQELLERDKKIAGDAFNAAREVVWPSNVAISNENLIYRKFKIDKTEYLNNLK